MLDVKSWVCREIGKGYTKENSIRRDVILFYLKFGEGYIIYK